jgi:hypothetical protein
MVIVGKLLDLLQVKKASPNQTPISKMRELAEVYERIYFSSLYDIHYKNRF